MRTPRDGLERLPRRRSRDPAPLPPRRLPAGRVGADRRHRRRRVPLGLRRARRRARGDRRHRARASRRSRAGVPLWSRPARFFVVARLRARARADHAATRRIAWRDARRDGPRSSLEYALLAPAVAAAAAQTADLLVALWSLVVWSCAATVVGVAQFFGADVFPQGTVGHAPGVVPLVRRLRRALGGSRSSSASSALVVPRLRARARSRRRRADVTGALGTIVAGAIASVLGLATALAVLAIVLIVRRELRCARAASPAQ